MIQKRIRKKESSVQNTMMIGVILMLLSSLLTSTGQLCWKLSYGELNWFLFFGFILYAIGAIIMIIAFRFGDLSKLHPLLCSSYVFAIIFGYFILCEDITLNKLIGSLSIIAGVALIGGKSDD